MAKPAMKREYATYHRKDVELEDGKFVWSVKPEQVRVMVRSEGYAMVRHKGAMPFVVSVKDLEPLPEGSQPDKAGP